MAITPIATPEKQKRSPLESFASALGIVNSVANTAINAKDLLKPKMKAPK